MVTEHWEHRKTLIYSTWNKKSEDEEGKEATHCTSVFVHVPPINMGPDER